MATKEKPVQTTVRMDPEELRELQYYLSLEGISWSKFVVQKAKDFLHDYRQAHPERVPGGMQSDHRSSPS